MVLLAGSAGSISSCQVRWESSLLNWGMATRTIFTVAVVQLHRALKAYWGYNVLSRKDQIYSPAQLPLMNTRNCGLVSPVLL